MYAASDLRKGLSIKIDNEPHVITEFNFVKPGKGQALCRSELKNMITGSQFERTFRSADVFEPADLKEKKMQYLYRQDEKYCFMDSETYEQSFLTEDQVGEEKNYLIDNLEVQIQFFEDKHVYNSYRVSIPNISVSLVAVLCNYLL